MTWLKQRSWCPTTLLTSGIMTCTSAILKMLNSRWADISSCSLLMWFAMFSNIDVQCCCWEKWVEQNMNKIHNQDWRGILCVNWTATTNLLLPLLWYIAILEFDQHDGGAIIRNDVECMVVLRYECIYRQAEWNYLFQFITCQAYTNSAEASSRVQKKQRRNNFFPYRFDQFTFSFFSISSDDIFWSNGSRTERIMFSSVMLNKDSVHCVCEWIGRERIIFYNMRMKNENRWCRPKSTKAHNLECAKLNVNIMETEFSFHLLISFHGWNERGNINFSISLSFHKFLMNIKHVSETHLIIDMRDDVLLQRSDGVLNTEICVRP